MATVAETGIGCAADKADKNRFASLDVAQSLVGKAGVGVIDSDEREALTEIADPMGVIVGLIPMTNPVLTLVFKTLICVKARDALIVRSHPDAASVGAMTVDLLRQVLARHGASADLVQSVPWRPTRAATAALMRHPGVSMILATGGTAMVKAAYSSGTPAIGVRSGNAPAWICADADVEAAAPIVVASKAFDHGIICGSENNLVVDRSVRSSFTGALQMACAAVLSPEECDRLAASRLRRPERAPAPQRARTGCHPWIAAEAGIEVPAGTAPARRPCPRRPCRAPTAGRSCPDPVAVHRRRRGRRHPAVPGNTRQRRLRPYSDHPHAQPAAAAVVRATDASKPDPGQRPRGARLHRPRQRAGAITHAWPAGPTATPRPPTT